MTEREDFSNTEPMAHEPGPDEAPDAAMAYDPAPAPAPAPGWTPARMAIMAVLVVVAVWLGWKAWTVNITMSCWKDEWPHLAVCEEINGRTVPEKIARLRERLAENPGDTVALVNLMVYAHQPDAPKDVDPKALLEQARKAAPQQGDVLRLTVYHALNEGRPGEAIEPLTRLSRYHHDADATRTLAEMILAAPGNEQIGTALIAAAKADTGWLDRVLRALPAAKVPTAMAMPLVNELVAQNTLTPKLGLALIRQLKAENQWMEAHALWMRLWNKPLPLLFNGGFDQAFVSGGFDWEVPGNNDHRGGALVSLAGRKGKGQVLRVEFNGKRMGSPIIRQYLMLPPGRYRFTGTQQSTELRSDKGLAWVFGCAADKRELVRIPGLKSTGREWKPMEATLEVPQDCGFGVVLTLQPEADYEARTGMRGEMVFDDFALGVDKGQP